MGYVLIEKIRHVDAYNITAVTTGEKQVYIMCIGILFGGQKMVLENNKRSCRNYKYTPYVYNTN